MSPAAGVPADPPTIPVPVLILPPPRPQRPPRQRPPASTPAAVLLNLTGLGLGYAYLGRRVLAGLAVAGTVLLVVLAFLTDASGTPWLWRGLVIGWLALHALHAGLVAQRHPTLTGKNRRRPALAGLLAVAVVVAGYVGYTVVGGVTYSDGLDAQAAGDCATATGEFDTVTGFYELTLSSDVLAAADQRTECAAYTRATDTQRRDEHQEAVRLYRDFRGAYPHSALEPYVHDNLARTYTDWARALREKKDYNEAIGVYRDLLDEVDGDSGGDTAAVPKARAAVAETYLLLAGSVRPGNLDNARTVVHALLAVLSEFSDTPSAPKVPGLLTTTYNTATKPYAAGKYCAALPVLGYFAGLSRGGTLTAIVNSANGNRARALLQCGLRQLRSGDGGSATATLTTFVRAYPHHHGIRQARSALIAATVSQGAGVRLRVPKPLGGNSPGSVPVSFYNDSRTPVRVLVSGLTAHDVTVPACGHCPASYPPFSDAGCPTTAGRPSVTLHLRPGAYYYVTEFRDSSVNNVTGSVHPTPGFVHSVCLWVEDAA